MEEGDLQHDFSWRVTSSPEDGDINWDCVDQLVAEMASIDSDVMFYGNNTLPYEGANMASNSPSFLASPSRFFLDPATNCEMPGCTNTSLMEPNTSVMSSQLPLTGNKVCCEVANMASSSPSFLASPSPLILDPATNGGMLACTNTSSMQPNTPAMSSQLPLTGNNMCVASSSPNFTASPSILPSNDEAATISAISSSENTCGAVTLGARDSVLDWVLQALTYIMKTRKKSTIVLTQVTMNGDGQFKMTITGQPFSLDQGSGRLDDAWPRIGHAKYPSVDRSSTLLPVFEKGNYSCLGFIEFIIIQKYIFTTDVNDICSALQIANLTTTDASRSPPRKFNAASYEEAIPEILQVIEEACTNHNLPLAQTWATCARPGKQCKRHADENCISIINEACYVKEPRMQFFHKACSKQHLQPGQGVVGEAYTTNLPCFQTDIGSSGEQEYPLSNRAKHFNLKGAAAIRLRSTRTGMDFVLEFFLPTDCVIENEQHAVLGSLRETLERRFQTLRLVRDKEMEDHPVWEMNELNSFGLQKSKEPMKRKGKRRSPVWKSYTEVMVGDTIKAMCNYCGKTLCCDTSKNGTSSMRSHSRRCKRNPDNRIKGPL